MTSDLDVEQNDIFSLTKLRGKAGMLVDSKIEGSSVTWKVDTGARRTFITEESYNNILPNSTPLFRPSEIRFSTASGST